MSKQVVAEVIALIELGMIAPEDIVKCLRKANSEPEQALAAPVQEPPPECQTEDEKRAYAFGWWKALEAQRALDKKAENARELGLDYEPVGWWDAKIGFFEEKHFDQLQPLYTTPPAAPVQELGPEPFGYFQYDIRLDAWVQNRINNKGVAFYTKEKP
jgi:hypothetical protein